MNNVYTLCHRYDDTFIPIDSYKDLFSNIKLIMYIHLCVCLFWVLTVYYVIINHEKINKAP